MTEVCEDGNRDEGAREAAAAIDAVLDQRCPEMKMAFWRAVEKYYRHDLEPGHRPPAVLDDHPPVTSR
jgi:hypothetical protein